MNRDFFSNNQVGEKLTLYYNELKKAIDRGYIKGETVQIVRKNGIVFDYVLDGEPVKPYEIITTEKSSRGFERIKRKKLATKQK